ncbi:spermidine/putrescine ABC transporter substrate-binding protein [Zobellella aerophila]
MIKKHKACVLVWVLFVCFSPSAETLHILNREGYLSDQVTARFEQNTGHRIEQIYYDNEKRRNALLDRADKYNFDLVLVDHNSARIFGARGLFSPLTLEQIPNLDQVPAFRKEQCGQFGAPYFWSTLGILYRADKVQPPPSSWRDLLVPDDHLKGHVGMLDNSLDTLVPPLAMLQQPLDSDDNQVLREAFSLLKAQSSWVLTYEYPRTYIRHDQQADRLYMAQGYSSDRAAMNTFSDQEHWRFVLPDEGTLVRLDCLAIFRHSPHQALATEFLNFLNQPEIAALNAEQTFATPANDAALTLLSGQFGQDSSIFPLVPALQNGQLAPRLDPKNMEIRNRITLAVLKNHETR